MVEQVKEPYGIDLKGILKVLDLPPLPELWRDGWTVDRELYRKLIRKVAENFLGTLYLSLREDRQDQFVVDLIPGREWRDAALSLGHLINWKAGEVVVDHQDRFLTGVLINGERKKYGDLRQAVLDNLPLLRHAHEAFGTGSPRQVLMASLEAVKEVQTATAGLGSGLSA